MFGVLADSSSFPHFLPKSLKCRFGFGKSVIDFQVIVGFSRDADSRVGEIIGSFK